MNYEALKKELSNFPQGEVGIYIQYLKKLETEKDKDQQIKNKWFRFATQDQFVELYKKVALDGLFIDGETITLQFKGNLMVSYNYQAYKNKLLKIYPETKFDIQNVYKGDEFSFKKESGQVKYSHVISNPFADNKEIIGCYCIIKNNRGDFLETLNLQEIEKMKKVAKTTKIWDEWFSEMTLKSVIKRACKRHFKDITTNIEILDNENYDLDLVNLEVEVREKIDEATSEEDLTKIYNEYLSKVTDEPAFLTQLTAKKVELKKQKEGNGIS